MVKETLFEAVGGKVIVKAASYAKPVVKRLGKVIKTGLGKVAVYIERKFGGVANKSGTQFLKSNWSKGTFDFQSNSILYHLKKHGKGRSAVQYTKDAMNIFKNNKNFAKEVVLKNGQKGFHIQKKYINEAGKKVNRGGYWDSLGKVITFWD